MSTSTRTRAAAQQIVVATPPPSPAEPLEAAQATFEDLVRQTPILLGHPLTKRVRALLAEVHQAVAQPSKGDQEG